MYILNESLLEKVLVPVKETNAYEFLYELEESYNELFSVQAQADFADHIAENTEETVELQEALSSIHESVLEKGKTFLGDMVSKLMALVTSAIGYITTKLTEVKDIAKRAGGKLKQASVKTYANITNFNDAVNKDFNQSYKEVIDACKARITGKDAQIPTVEPVGGVIKDIIGPVAQVNISAVGGVAGVVKDITAMKANMVALKGEIAALKGLSATPGTDTNAFRTLAKVYAFKINVLQTAVKIASTQISKIAGANAVDSPATKSEAPAPAETPSEAPAEK